MNSILFIGILLITIIIVGVAFFLYTKKHASPATTSSSTTTSPSTTTNPTSKKVVPVSHGVHYNNLPTTIVSLSIPKFQIKSLATGYYLGDNGMDATTKDALIFTETSTGNLMLSGSQWILKYVEWNGKAMLTNDNETGGYVVTNTSGHSGPSNPFMSIPSVQAVLSSQYARNFEVVKEYV